MSADGKTKCQEKSILMVRKIVPPVLSFLTGDDYTNLWESSWTCSECNYMNDEDDSKTVFVDNNEGSKSCVMCGAERNH
jgi:hypothetical protein